MPEPVADLLVSHPAPSAAVVVGRTDARRGEVPVAVLARTSSVPAPAPDELDAYVRLHLPATMIPMQYLFVAALPRTPSLKVDLAAVRRLVEHVVVPWNRRHRTASKPTTPITRVFATDAETAPKVGAVVAKGGYGDWI